MDRLARYTKHHRPAISRALLPAVLLLASLFLASACGNIEKPLVITGGAGDITHSSALLTGEIPDDGGSEILSRGFVWGLNPYPGLEKNTGSIRQDGATVSFTATVEGLTPGTVYYARAYAINSQGTSYGSSIMFTTASHTPRVHTSAVKDITTRGALSGGAVISTGGEPVSARGIVWSSRPGPTLEQHDAMTANGAATGAWSVSIEGLRHNTVYHLRAYATNIQGAAYGQEITFTTAPASLPKITTTAPTNISSRTAMAGGMVVDDGGATVTNRGMVVSTSEYPTTGRYDQITRDGAGTGSFTSELRSLLPGTEYYLRSWAVNDAGTSYGEQKSFTTPVPRRPEVSLLSVAETETSRAEVHMSVDGDGHLPVTARGIVWSRSEMPTVDDHEGIIASGAGTGPVSGTMAGLNPGTVYYIRSWATNETGTGYSRQWSLKTSVLLPRVHTAQLTGYNGTTALLTATIMHDGGDSGTERGFIIGTAPDPTPEDNQGIVRAGTGTGDFTGEFRGLAPGETYYARAYAVNWAGTAYGRQARFSTVPACGTEVTFTRDGEKVTYGTVEGVAGACWMDRNMGAVRVATSRRDDGSFGDLYQWDSPEAGYPSDDGTETVHPNDLCPAGWRLPTAGEWQEEMDSWRRPCRRQAYRSPLRLPSAGMIGVSGRSIDEGRRGYYWSSCTDDEYSKVMTFNFWSAGIQTSSREAARSVRCIRVEEGRSVEWLP